MKNTKAIVFLFFCLLVGLSLGIVQAARLDATSLHYLEARLSTGFQDQSWQSSAFVQSVLNNGGLMLLLWVLAFLPMGRWAACGVLSFKAMGYGFTGMILTRAYGGAGFSYILTRLGPQAVILLSAAMFLCYDNFQRDNRPGTIGPAGKPITTYFLALLIAELCAVLASFI